MKRISLVFTVASLLMLFLFYAVLQLLYGVSTLVEQQTDKDVAPSGVISRNCLQQQNLNSGMSYRLEVK